MLSLLRQSVYITERPAVKIQYLRWLGCRMIKAFEENLETKRTLRGLLTLTSLEPFWAPSKNRNSILAIAAVTVQFIQSEFSGFNS